MRVLWGLAVALLFVGGTDYGGTVLASDFFYDSSHCAELPPGGDSATSTAFFGSDPGNETVFTESRGGTISMISNSDAGIVRSFPSTLGDAQAFSATFDPGTARIFTVVRGPSVRDHIEVRDATTGSDIGAIEGYASIGTIFDNSGGIVYASATTHDGIPAILAINPATLAVRAAIAVGSAADGSHAPDAYATLGGIGGDAAIVNNWASQNIELLGFDPHIVDPAKQLTLKTDLRSIGVNESVADSFAYDHIFSEANRFLLTTTLPNGSGMLYAVNASHTPALQWKLPLAHGGSLVVDPDTWCAYIASPLSSDLLVIDLRHHQQVGTFHLQEPVSTLYHDEHSGHVFMATATSTRVFLLPSEAGLARAPSPKPTPSTSPSPAPTGDAPHVPSATPSTTPCAPYGSSGCASGTWQSTTGTLQWTSTPTPDGRPCQVSGLAELTLRAAPVAQEPNRIVGTLVPTIGPQTPGCNNRYPHGPQDALELVGHIESGQAISLSDRIGDTFVGTYDPTRISLTYTSAPRGVIAASSDSVRGTCDSYCTETGPFYFSGFGTLFQGPTTPAPTTSPTTTTTPKNSPGPDAPAIVIVVSLSVSLSGLCLRAGPRSRSSRSE